MPVSKLIRSASTRARDRFSVSFLFSPPPPLFPFYIKTAREQKTAELLAPRFQLVGQLCERFSVAGLLRSAARAMRSGSRGRTVAQPRFRVLRRLFPPCHCVRVSTLSGEDMQVAFGLRACVCVCLRQRL